MTNRIYTFSPIENRDNEEVAKYKALYLAKSPALSEFLQFIATELCGRYVEISEATIDDAFDCLTYRDKTHIYASDLSKEEKKRRSDSAEANWKVSKEFFKATHKVKSN